jgi:PAS domain S-box-containing protein
LSESGLIANQTRAVSRPFWSIRAKLTVFTVALMAAISISVFIFIPPRMEEQVEQGLVDKAASIADMTAFAIGSSSDLSRPEDVLLVLSGAAQVEDLVYAYVTGLQSNVIAEFNRLPDAYPVPLEFRMPGGISQNHDIYRARRSIVSGGQQIGTLHMGVSLLRVAQISQNSRFTIAIASLFIFVFGLSGVWAVNNVIASPLRGIVTVAEQIAQGDFEGRLDIHSKDEIGRLASAFNRMVQSLRAAYRHLESVNATLAYHSQDLQAEIAERRKAEEGMRASEAKFRAVVEHATDLVAVLDNTGSARYVSPACINIMGVTPESLTGERVDEYIHPADLTRFRSALLQSRRDMAAVIQVEARWRHANGTWRYLAFRGRNLADLPGIEGILINVTDITEAKQFECELVLAKETAEEMVRLKDSFLANMSHEIRTPLTGILGFAQILSSEVDDSQRELVGHIHDSGNRLLNTLNSVLDLAELEARSVRPELEPVDVVSEIRDAARLIAPVAKLKNLTFEIQVPGRPLVARTNASCLHRVIMNLVSNAVKFTDDGSVRVITESDDRHVHITVADTGVGISEDFKPRLFSEFTQESTGNARTHEGSGLGLAITRRLVDLIDGAISVESEKGSGSRFTVSLPLAERDTAARTQTVPWPSLRPVLPQRTRQVS